MAFGITPWDPLRDFDRMFRHAFEGFGPSLGAGRMATAFPLDIYDQDGSYVVRCELPGVKTEDVDLTMSGNVLSIRGSKRPYLAWKGTELEGEVVLREGGEKAGAEKAGGKATAKAGKAETFGQAGTALERAGETALVGAEGLDGGRALYSECSYGSFERTVNLPDDIDPEKIEAREDHGVLWVRVGKKAEQRARRISVTRH